MNDSELLRAANHVSEFLLAAAGALESVLGFTWKPDENAPSTYPELKRQFVRSLATGRALSVSSEYTDPVIYSSPDVNIAYRFVHDVTHVLRGLDFSAPHELQLALIHLESLHRAGYGPGSLEYRLFEADAVGQARLQAIGGRFPVDQQVFIENCLHYGIDRAILEEIGQEASPKRPQSTQVITFAAA